MDTKWKSIKHSLWTKGICLMLSVAFLALSVFTAAEVMRVPVFFEDMGVLTGDIPDFEKIPEYQRLLRTHMNAVARVSTDVQTLIESMQAQRDTMVKEALESYKEKKADAIRAELLYVAKSFYGEYNSEEGLLYDETSGYFNNEAALKRFRSIVDELGDAPVQSVVTEDETAPLNILAAQKILNRIQGTDLLAYADCVRSSAFLDNSWNYTNTSLAESTAASVYGRPMFSAQTEDLSLSEQDAAKVITSDFDVLINNYATAFTRDSEMSKELLKGCVNFKYYVRNDITGEEFGNVRSSEGLSRRKVHFAMSEGETEAIRLESILTQEVEKLFAESKNYTVYFWLEDTLQPGDGYYDLNMYYEKATSVQPGRLAAISVVYLALSIVFFVILMCLAGHKNGVEGISVAFIDKLPGDVHLLLSVGVCTGIVTAVAAVLISIWESSGYTYAYEHTAALRLFWSWWIPALAAVVTGVCAFIAIEAIASVVRTLKAGKPWFRKFIIVIITMWLFRGTARFIRLVGRGLGNFMRAFTYKPKRLKMLTIFGIVLFTLFNLVFILLCFASPVFILFVLVWNAGALYFAAEYAKNLDRIIVAATQRSEFVACGNLPNSLRLLADSLSYTNTELNRAISKAVKDERLKTELITNVSHDLKTPLTSVISYVDLLKKCDISDESAQQYICVLEEKADKLKRLIEDLMEASKVSTGNVTINRVNLNLAELAVQAIVEANPEFEKAQLEIRFDEPEKPPVIFADSQKTYRVLENLLSNAKKYSAPGSRVYARVYETGRNGVFELKNISKDALNISAQELTERFVRGDRSRSDEGNGLGLSIAKELCALQGGQLIITIDGDLFKAEVLLPSAQE